MTREQLDLLIRYINTKIAITRHEAKHSNAPLYLTDDLVSTLAQLEETTS